METMWKWKDTVVDNAALFELNPKAGQQDGCYECAIPVQCGESDGVELETDLLLAVEE